MLMNFLDILFEHFILFWLLFIVVTYYFVTPIAMWLFFTLSAYPNLAVLHLDEIAKSHARFLRSQADALVASGFDEPTYIQTNNVAPHMTHYVVLLANRQTGDQAEAQIALGTMPLVPFFKLTFTQLAFTAYFEVGTVFNTNNFGNPPDWLPGPREFRFQLPSLQDPQELFRFHTFVMNRHQVAGRKRIYEPGHAVDFLANTGRITFDEQVKRGWLYYNERKGIFRLTFLGAFYVSWRQLQPMKLLCKMAIYRKQRQLLQEFRAASLVRDQCNVQPGTQVTG